MAETPMVSLQIDKDMLKQAVEKEVGQVVAASLVGQEELIQKMIRDIMNQRVDRDGKPYHNGQHTYLEWIGLDALRGAVKAGMQAAMAKKQAEFTLAVEKHIIKCKTPIAQALVSGMLESLQSNWTSHVTFNIKTARD